MKKDDLQDFTNLWNAIYSFYQKEASAMMVSLAFAALIEYELPDINRALQAHIKNPDGGKWPPKPADVVKFIDGGPETRAAIALTKAHKAAQRCGRYESVCFDDPVIHHVIRDMGGWVAWCLIEEKERPFKHNEFQKRYTGALSGQREDHPMRLMGITELTNSRAGFDEFVKPPVIIGDEQKAKQVYLTGVSKNEQFKRIGEDILSLAMGRSGKKLIGFGDQKD